MCGGELRGGVPAGAAAQQNCRRRPQVPDRDEEDKLALQSNAPSPWRPSWSGQEGNDNEGLQFRGKERRGKERAGGKRRERMEGAKVKSGGGAQRNETMPTL